MLTYKKVVKSRSIEKMVVETHTKAKRKKSGKHATSLFEADEHETTSEEGSNIDSDESDDTGDIRLIACFQL